MLVDDDGSDAADRIAVKVEQWTAQGFAVLTAPAFDDIEGGGRDWNDLLQSDGPHAVRDRLALIHQSSRPRRDVQPPRSRRPVRQHWQRWKPLAGEAAALLLTAGTRVGKTSLAIQIFIHLEAERGRERDAFIRDYRTEHNVSLHAAGQSPTMQAYRCCAPATLPRHTGLSAKR